MIFQHLALLLALVTLLPGLAAAQWAAGPDLPVGRAHGQLVKIANGSLVAIGGDLGSADSTLVHALGADGTVWSTLPNLDASRVGQGAIAGPSGTVLQFGGMEQDNILQDTYYYDPASGDIHPLNPMTSTRANFAFSWDGQGRAYAFGGFINSSYLSTVERFDPRNEQWTTLAPMPKVCSFCSAAWDGQDSIFVFTGPQTSSAVLRYKISTNVWTAAAPAPVGLSMSSAVLAPNGHIYLLGGVDYRYMPVALVQVYDPQSDTWTIGTPLPQPVYFSQAALDSRGRIVVAGGYDANNGVVAKTWVSPPLQPQNAVPVITSTPPTQARADFSYSYFLRASGFPSPTYALRAGPPGMTLSSGVLSWTPTLGQIGTFTVTIQASNSQGSNTQSFALKVLPPVPPVPLALTQRAVTSVSVTLAWQPVTYKYQPLTYNVSQYVSSGGRNAHSYWSQIATGISTPYYTLKGLKAGQEYTLAISSTSPGGTSALSPAIYVITLIPASPTSLSASAVKATSATLSWAAGKGNPPTSTDAIYTDYGQLLQAGITVTHSTVYNLSPSTNYHFYVVAYDANGGSSAASPVVYVSTPAH